jgi:hypothetical protein
LAKRLFRGRRDHEEHEQQGRRKREAERARADGNETGHANHISQVDPGTQMLS